ncbi:hypothetical protein DYGSA30_18060 [Dyella sp. GSA-30]|nr:hypothetical protein DYGSA30_18060 [Dyella sp. GSA-30]
MGAETKSGVTGDECTIGGESSGKAFKSARMCTSNEAASANAPAAIKPASGHSDLHRGLLKAACSRGSALLPDIAMEACRSDEL